MLYIHKVGNSVFQGKMDGIGDYHLKWNEWFSQYMHHIFSHIQNLAGNRHDSMNRAMCNIEVGEVKRKDNEMMIRVKGNYLYIVNCHNESFLKNISLLYNTI